MAGKSGCDIREILDVLPHRYPFLLVDRITSYENSRCIEGYKNVSFNEPFFQGHFPGDPIMPGVLIVEAMAQVGAMLMTENVPDYKNKLILFLGIDDVRFRRPVRPGDRLDMRVEITRFSLRASKLKAVAKVGDQEAARATLLASVVDRSSVEGNS